MNKRTVTLVLSQTELEVLERLCSQKGTTKTALLKQSLRLYEAVHTRILAGEKIYTEDEAKNKAELVVI